MGDTVASLRGDILLKAHKTINKDRQSQYGDAEDNFGLIAEYWNAYLDGKYPDVLPTITPADVAMMMVFLKAARIATGVHREDNYVDLAGYAALAADMEGKEVARLREMLNRTQPAGPKDSMDEPAREFRERKKKALEEFFSGF